MTSFSHPLLPGKVSASHLLLVEFRGNILYLWTLRLTQGAHQVIERPIRVSKVDVSFMSPQICHAWREFCWSCMFPVLVASASASIGLLRSVSILNPRFDVLQDTADSNCMLSFTLCLYSNPTENLIY